MKELTIEEKAKAYDKAIKRAKELTSQCINSRYRRTMIYRIDDIEEIFPELQKSEGEKIREKIIATIHLYYGEPLEDEAKEMIAWLEKQGINYSLVEEIKKRKDSFMREKEKAVSSNDKLSLGARIAMLEELLVFADEKQGESKPADEVEPKDYNSIDPHFGKPIDKVEPKFKVKYAGSEYNVLETKEIAGVTYYGIEDEPNHIDYILPDNCEIVRDHSYGVKEKGTPYPTKSAIFSEQKLTWSEEDETRLTNIIIMLKEGASHHFIKNGITKAVDWLKSLKNRVQPKQEWGERDKEEFQKVYGG